MDIGLQYPFFQAKPSESAARTGEPHQLVAFVMDTYQGTGPRIFGMAPVMFELEINFDQNINALSP
jgi:hypothetical protein